MKFTINKGSLLDGLGAVASVVRGTPTVPALGFVHMEYQDAELTLTTTDLELSARVQMSCVGGCGGKNGGALLPTKKLLAIVRELPLRDIEFETDDKDCCRIVCGSTRFKLVGLPEAEFPAVAGVGDGAATMTLDREAFAGMLRLTAYAASDDAARVQLCGVGLSYAKGTLTAAASDGKRLAIAELDVDGKIALDGTRILPERVVAELLRLVDGEGKIEVRLTAGMAEFAWEQTVVRSKLLEGAFPNFRQVIPAASNARASVPREDLLVSLRRVSCFADAANRAVKLTFEADSLEIVARSPDVGEGTDRLFVKFQGDKLSINVNPDYLFDPLKQLGCDEVIFETEGPTSPLVIKGDVPFTYVLMPLKV